jgi:hypothetical protein
MSTGRGIVLTNRKWQEKAAERRSEERRSGWMRAGLRGARQLDENSCASFGGAFDADSAGMVLDNLADDG